MTDNLDLDDLKAALKAATPRPDDQRRAANLLLAQKNFARAQESRAQPRPMTRRNIWTGPITMLNTLIARSTSRSGLTVTTALVACGFMVATPQGRDILNLSPAAPPAQLSAPLPDDTATDAVTSRSLPPAQAEQMAGIGLNELAMDREGAQVPRSSPAAPLQIARGTPGVAESFAPAPMSTRTETFANADPNPLKITAEAPVSTFSIDVDTTAYAITRAYLNAGTMPPIEALRIEEFINYFPYNYPAPAPDDAAPLRPTVTLFQTPWNPDTQLIHIGLQGRMVAAEDRSPLNLVFLIDTSGSMAGADRLPLLRQSLRLLLDNLQPEDEVAIVTYAGTSTVALEPTPASDTSAIIAALNALAAEGSTNGESGLEQAYAMAERMAQDGEATRVILATDGDFNLGLNAPRALESYISEKRNSGTYLSVLGFGRGNLNDATMQALAQHGNGTAAFIDSLSEAQKVLVDGLAGTLVPLADDVKIQIEFNPETVAEYRLIGYETRALNRVDFNNDAVDAGELGAGHTVTALYEITPTGSPARQSDPLRYQSRQAPLADTPDEEPSELAFLRLRYKPVGEHESRLIETPIRAGDATATPLTEALFAVAIAGFGQLLRNDPHLRGWSYEDAIELAKANRGTDPNGYRAEAVQLMRLAQALSD